MKVLVLNNAIPFVTGGAELFAHQLVDRLNVTPGVEAELLRIPFRWQPAERIFDEVMLNQNFGLYFVDRVIGLKFPAYLIPHTHKTLWLLHQFRQVYDLRDAGLSHVTTTKSGDEIAQFVRNADNQCFRQCKALYVNSPVTADRLKKYNGFDATVLYPPLLDPERFTGGDYGSYIFAGGRIGPGKRQHLLIEAMRHVRSTLRLVIAGPSDDNVYASQIEKLIDRYDLSGRVELRIGLRSREEIAGLVNGALACAYLPIDEDSLGYVTMEAFSARKPVVTLQDAGGVLGIVRDNETGIVANTDPRSIAAAFEKLSHNPALAADMGRTGNELMRTKVGSWEMAIERLLS